MINYIITTARDGTVRLTKRSDWGNIPMASVAHAEEVARQDAGGAPHAIKHEAIRF